MQDVKRGSCSEPGVGSRHPGPLRGRPGEVKPRHARADPEHDHPGAGQQQAAETGQHPHLSVP